jgi:SAM-dependent methyltransferase
MFELDSTINIALADAIGRPRTVLDVGCGLGLNGSVARAGGARTVGIEADAAKARSARRTLDEVLELDWRDTGAVGAALGERRFDLILFPEVLGRGEDAGRVLASYVRYLTPEGHVIASFNSRESWAHRKVSSGADSANPIRLFTHREAIDLVEGAGLQVLRVEHNPMILRALGPVLERSHWISVPPGVDPDPGFRDLPVYKAYRAFVRPLEESAAKIGPEFLSHQHVVVARSRPRKGPLSLVVGMLTMDEEPSVVRMMDEIHAVAPDAKVLCVDSSMKDKTPILAESKGAQVIRQLPPRGHGPAMEVLMYEAARQADALIYLDCDFTYPPRIIPVIRRLLEEGADVVNAARTRSRPDAMPLPNYIANKSFAMAAQAAFGVPTSDLHSGMRGYRSSVIRAFSFDGEGDALPIDTLLWPARCGYDVIEIPIDYQERVGYSKLRKFAGTVWTFVRLGKTVRVGSRGTTNYRILDRQSG